MKRPLLFLSLFLLAPVFGAAYFFLEAMPAGTPAEAPPTDGVGTPRGNWRAAQTAYERANRFLNRAIQSSSENTTDLLRQAMIQYRVCLAYETGTPNGDQLFAEAHRKLEASRLLLEQSSPATPNHSAESSVVRSTPPSPQPAPAGRQPETTEAPAATPKPPAGPVKVDREASAASKLPTEQKPKTQAEPQQRPVPPPPPPAEDVHPKKTQPKEPPSPRIITVGPDGVIFEKVEKSGPDKK